MKGNLVPDAYLAAIAIAKIAGIEMCWAYMRGVYLEAAPNIIRA